MVYFTFGFFDLCSQISPVARNASCLKNMISGDER